MQVTLNLATRPFSDVTPVLRRLRIGMGILAALCLACGLGLYALHQKAEQARASEHALDIQLAAIAQERQGYQAMMQRPDNAQLLKETDALNKLFDDKAFSWTLAMENLETVLPAGVQVATIEPIRNKDGEITIHLRVVGPHDRSVELVRNLEHSRRFLAPRIVGENSEASNNPNQRIEPVSMSNRYTFDLLAEYNPPSPNEPRPAPAARPSATRLAGHAELHPAGSPGVVPPGGRRPYTGPQPSRSKPSPDHGGAR